MFFFFLLLFSVPLKYVSPHISALLLSYSASAKFLDFSFLLLTVFEGMLAVWFFVQREHHGILSIIYSTTCFLTITSFNIEFPKSSLSEYTASSGLSEGESYDKSSRSSLQLYMRIRMRKSTVHLHGGSFSDYRKLGELRDKMKKK